MSVLAFEIAITGILMVLTAIAGIIVSALGRLLNTVAFTIHKLIAVSSAVLAAIVVYSLLKNVKIGAPVTSSILIAALFFLSLFVSGAFLSFEKPVNALLLAIHKAAPLLTVSFAMLSTCLYLRTEM